MRFKRFHDLTSDDLDVDLHLHTTRTDGQADIDAILDDACARGLKRVAFTEHVRRDTMWFPEFADDVRARAAHHPELEVLVGCEAKALDRDGSLDATEAILSSCDVVLGSVHRFPDGQGGFVSSAILSQDATERLEFDLAWGLASKAPIDVLAHPGGMYARRFGVDLPEYLMRRLLVRSLERGIAVEISSSYLHDMTAFIRLCAEINPFVSIGSDMHRLEDLGSCRGRLIALGVARS